MKDSSKEYSVWTRGRFLGVVALLFVLQAGMIVLFGARGTTQRVAPTASTQFRAIAPTLTDEQLRRLFFVSDPAVFALPSAHGFSGRAWMNQTPPQYQPSNQLEAPRWLALDAARLGTGSAIFEEADATAPLMPGRHEIPRLEPLPVFLSPTIVPTQSVFHIEGELANRFIGSPPALRAWPSPSKGLLANTVVEIAVNQAGDVLAARLVSRCGSAEADADAVAKASELRFRPTVNARITWASAVFRWQTTFPAAAGTPP